MDDIIVEYERIIGRPDSPKFSCEEHDHFQDDNITDSQLLHCVEASTQGRNPEGLAQVQCYYSTPNMEVLLSSHISILQ